MKSKGLPLLALGLVACGGHRIRTQTPAPAAIAEATARLKARGVPLDAEGVTVRHPIDLLAEALP